MPNEAVCTLSVSLVEEMMDSYDRNVAAEASTSDQQQQPQQKQKSQLKGENNLTLTDRLIEQYTRIQAAQRGSPAEQRLQCTMPGEVDDSSHSLCMTP